MNIQILETIFKLNKNQIRGGARGGGWYGGIETCTDRRNRIAPGARVRYVGFRLAQEK